MKLEKKKKRKTSTMLSLLKPGALLLLAGAKEYPIYECLINKNWKSLGEGNIILSRKLPDNGLLVGVYLVDLYCLGMKNTFHLTNISHSKYNGQFKKSMCKEIDFVDCPVNLAHSIIYGSIEYAEKLGLSPHPDFKKSRMVLEPEGFFKRFPKVMFGLKGKPFYMSGPDDDVQSILDTLDKNVGRNNYDYMLDEHGFNIEI